MSSLSNENEDLDDKSLKCRECDFIGTSLHCLKMHITSVHPKAEKIIFLYYHYIIISRIIE